MKAHQTKINNTLLNNKGFTLTEMLIVIAIIGIVMTLVASNVSSKFARAKVDSTRIQIKQLGVILDDFKRECGFYPNSDQGLKALIEKPSSGRECKNYDPEGYIKDKRIPKDAWGTEFTYESDGNKYVLGALGDDAQVGGEKYAADLSSNDKE